MLPGQSNQQKASDRLTAAKENRMAFAVCDKFGNTIWLAENRRIAESMITKSQRKSGWHVIPYRE